MMSAVLLALGLDGLLPAAVAARRPAPLIRYDRVRIPRPAAHLAELATRLSEGGAPPSTADGTAGLDGCGTRSVGGGSGWTAVWFTSGA